MVPPKLSRRRSSLKVSGLIGYKRLTKKSEINKKLPVGSDHINRIDAKEVGQLHNSLTHHTVCGILDDIISGLQIAEVLQETVCCAWVDAQNSSITSRDVVRDLVECRCRCTGLLSPGTYK